ncbi:hypothetical protein QW131_16160 [Roseibium salinum]|nr:hypothetical protein [Roseibium salinum]
MVEGAEEIEVLMSDRTSYTAELVGADPATDLAVLKIDPPEDLTIARWGDSRCAAARRMDHRHRQPLRPRRHRDRRRALGPLPRYPLRPL